MVKFILFDMDGVIFDPSGDDGNTSTSVWSAIYRSLGEEALKSDEEGKGRWRRGEFGSYVDWMRYSAQKHT